MAAHSVRRPRARYRRVLPTSASSTPRGSAMSIQRTVTARSAEACTNPASTSRRPRLSDRKRTGRRDTSAAYFPAMRLACIIFPSAVSGGEGSSGLESAGSRLPAPGRRYTTPTGPVPRRRGTDPHHRSHNIQDPSLDLSYSLYIFMSLFILFFPCRAVRAVCSYTHTVEGRYRARERADTGIPRRNIGSVRPVRRDQGPLDRKTWEQIMIS